MGIKKVSGTDAKKSIGATNWQAIKSMTDEEIKKSSIADPISKELRVNELLEFKREITTK
tara:strand:- start:2276 stop:2455 length:180 start_codon:yes stop_codon:yes gene_type:complete